MFSTLQTKLSFFLFCETMKNLKKEGKKIKEIPKQNEIDKNV
jgi:hypothetical protein